MDLWRSRPKKNFFGSAASSFCCLRIAHELGCELSAPVANCATLHGHSDCLRYALEHACPITHGTAGLAAEGGVVECLRLVHQHGGIVDANGVGAIAAMHGYGHLQSLEYVLDQGIAPTRHLRPMACSSGNLACLQLLSARGATWDTISARMAASDGHSVCLCFTKPIMPLAVTDCIKGAAEGGHVLCLKLLKGLHITLSSAQLRKVLGNHGTHATFVSALLESGFLRPEQVAVSAARNGNIDCLEYIVGVHDCELTATIAMAAIHKQGLLCLKYALAHSCPLPDDACALAAERGLFKMLLFLHEYGCALTLKTCVVAARNKHGDCLTYAVTHGAPVDATICAAAAGAADYSYTGATDTNPTEAETGDPFALVESEDDADEDDMSVHLRLLLYTHYELGCPWDELTCAAAAAHSDGLECLQHAHKNGCPWDATTTTAAARAGLLRNLAYALQRGCPCDAGTSLAAAKHGDLRAQQLLRAHGCPCDPRVSQAAAASGDASCWRYCVEQGCPKKDNFMDLCDSD